ncbi:hypothetical protein SAMN05216228_1015133 [Rhizobium tibeticum]|uniref:Uncharacterized protein n=1 Tax=Rhizobium tibeticum TaxID=501024 RepID=A0ABY1AP77_9HYPH|nr:hypothetical protein SAMN05216228_1015133 [Rhizobium tibeticum]
MTVAKTEVLYLTVRREADPELFDLFVRRNLWMSRKVAIPLAYFQGAKPQEVRSIVKGYLRDICGTP